MTTESKGRADYLALGDWNVVCFECGRKRKASTMKRHWQGYWVCPEHWEPRQPQDFVKGTKDIQTPEWVQPMPADTFVPIPLTLRVKDTVQVNESRRVIATFRLPHIPGNNGPVNGNLLNAMTLNASLAMTISGANYDRPKLAEHVVLSELQTHSDSMHSSETVTLSVSFRSSMSLNGALLDQFTLG